MRDDVKISIDARRNAIMSAYDIKNESLLKKVDDLFRKIEELGKESNDLMDFENKFASSELNQEYISLFTEISTSCTPIIFNEENTEVKSDGERVLDDIYSEVKYQADSLTHAARRQARQKAYDEVRDLPVIGEVMTAKQHFDFFKKFKKKD